MSKPKRSPIEVLREAQDRIMSLSADDADIKPAGRVFFRGGFAQCRHAARDLMAEIIAEMEGK